MRNCQFVVWLVFALEASSLLASAGLVNGDFETGDLAGWQFDASGTPDFIRPYPDPTYPETFTYEFPMSTTPVFSNVRVVDVVGRFGENALHMYSHQSGMRSVSFTDPDGNPYVMQMQAYTMTCSQTVQLPQGSQLTGWARFCSVDVPGNWDAAWVSINGTQVWSFDLDQLGNTELNNVAYGPWQEWQFTVPASGEYTLGLNILGDGQYASWVYFSDIDLVPEPASAGLLILGVSLMALQSRRRCSCRSPSSPLVQLDLTATGSG